MICNIKISRRNINVSFIACQLRINFMTQVLIEFISELSVKESRFFVAGDEVGVALDIFLFFFNGADGSCLCTLLRGL